MRNRPCRSRGYVCRDAAVFVGERDGRGGCGSLRRGRGGGRGHLGISEYRAQREERLFQPDAMGGAANLNQHQSEFKTASIPAQQQDATPYAAASASQAQAEQSTSAFLSGLTGAFQRCHADDGVPTIARAADAMDEAEAWSMIDSMLDDDSPVSCDPARSRRYRRAHQRRADRLPQSRRHRRRGTRRVWLPGRPCGQHGSFRGTRCQRGSQ